jgi:hypothetical protein
MAIIPQSFVSRFIEASWCPALTPDLSVSPVTAIIRHTDGFVGQNDPIRPKIQFLVMDYSHTEYNIPLIICIDRIERFIYRQVAYKTWK